MRPRRRKDDTGMIPTTPSLFDVSIPGAWVILGGGYKDKRKKFSLVEVRVHDGRNFNTDPIPITK